MNFSLCYYPSSILKNQKRNKLSDFIISYLIFFSFSLSIELQLPPRNCENEDNYYVHGSVLGCRADAHVRECRVRLPWGGNWPRFLSLSLSMLAPEPNNHPSSQSFSQQSFAI